MIPKTTFQFSDGLFFVCLFASVYNFQDVFLDFEHNTHLYGDPGHWTFRIKENIIVSDLDDEDAELAMAIYYIFLNIFHPSLFF